APRRVGRAEPCRMIGRWLADRTRHRPADPIPSEIQLDIARARGENGKAPAPEEASPRLDEVWSSAAQAATIGIFVILLGATFYFCRPILRPVLAAMVVGMTFGPVVKAAARRGLSPWLTALALGVVLVVAVGAAATWLSAPITEWIAKAPEIGA